MIKVKAKHQRLVLIGLAMLALIGAGLLATWALRNQASYFYVPSELRANPPVPGRAVRRFRGIAPSLFVEGSGVVAEGALGADGTFVANNLLAKHDENYVPREMRAMTDEQAKQVVAETK
jgi:cytochrome c-type biogenesis protein CcmE